MGGPGYRVLVDSGSRGEEAAHEIIWFCFCFGGYDEPADGKRGEQGEVWFYCANRILRTNFDNRIEPASSHVPRLDSKRLCQPFGNLNLSVGQRWEIELDPFILSFGGEEAAMCMKSRLIPWAE